MPVSYNFMVTPGAVLRPQILNGISFPAFYCLRVCCDQKIAELFLGQIRWEDG